MALRTGGDAQGSEVIGWAVVGGCVTAHPRQPIPCCTVSVGRGGRTPGVHPRGRKLNGGGCTLEHFAAIESKD